MTDATTTSEMIKPGLPTPHLPSGNFSISSTTIIHGTANDIFNALTQVEFYPKWNTFVPLVTPSTPLALGEIVLFDVQLDPSPAAKMHSHEQVVVYEPGKRLVITGTDYPWVYKAERIHTIEDLGDGTCRYYNHATMGGIVSPLMLWAKGAQFKDRFYDWAADLKKYVEGKEVGTFLSVAAS